MQLEYSKGIYSGFLLLLVLVSKSDEKSEKDRVCQFVSECYNFKVDYCNNFLYRANCGQNCGLCKKNYTFVDCGSPKCSKTKWKLNCPWSCDYYKFYYERNDKIPQTLYYREVTDQKVKINLPLQYLTIIPGYLIHLYIRFFTSDSKKTYAVKVDFTTNEVNLKFLSQKGFAPCAICVNLFLCTKGRHRCRHSDENKICSYNYITTSLKIYNLSITYKRITLQTNLNCFGYLGYRRLLLYLFKNKQLDSNDYSEHYPQGTQNNGELTIDYHSLRYRNTYDIGFYSSSKIFYICSENTDIKYVRLDKKKNLIFAYVYHGCDTKSSVKIMLHVYINDALSTIPINKWGFGKLRYTNKDISLRVYAYVNITLVNKIIITSKRQNFHLEGTIKNKITQLYVNNSKLFIEWLNYMRKPKVIIESNNIPVTHDKITGNQGGVIQFITKFRKIECFICVKLKDCEKNCGLIDEKCLTQAKHAKPLIIKWNEKMRNDKKIWVFEFKQNCENGEFNYFLNVDTEGDETPSFKIRTRDTKEIKQSIILYTMPDDLAKHYQFGVIYAQLLRCRKDKKSYEECAASEEFELKDRCGYLPKINNVKINYNTKKLKLFFERKSIQCEDFSQAFFIFKDNHNEIYEKISPKRATLIYEIPIEKKISKRKEYSYSIQAKFTLYIKKCSTFEFCTLSHPHTETYYYVN